MKKRINVFLLLLVMLVGVFGSVSVSAAELESDSMTDFEICKNYNLQGFITYSYPNDKTYSNGFSVTGCTGDFTCLLRVHYGSKNDAYDTLCYLVSFSNSESCSFTYTGYKKLFNSYDYKLDTNPYFVDSWDRVDGFSGESYCYAQHLVSSIMHGESILSCYSSYIIIDVDCENADVNYYDVAYHYWKTGELSSDYASVVLPDENVSSDYDSSLGYLKNVRRDSFVTSGSQTGADDYRFKYSYSYTTTTGYDLRDDGADVEYLIKLKGGYRTLTGQYYSLPTLMGENGSMAGNGKNHFYIDSATFNSLIQDFRTDGVPFTATLEFDSYVYMRPIRRDSTGYYYGGWTRCHMDENGNLVVDNGTTSTGDVSQEADGEEDDFVIDSTSVGDTGFGSGTDFDDAESNMKPSGSSSIDADLMENAESLIRQIGEIPQLISTLFSFLPSWCLTLFGVGFGIIVLLIIYKLVRG